MSQKTKQVARPSRLTFVAICRDGPDAPHHRAEQLNAHLRYVAERLDSYRVAGPVAADISDEYTGSIIIVAADSEAEARAVLEGDPYMSCGMYAQVEVLPFVPAAGHWLGGVTWEPR